MVLRYLLKGSGKGEILFTSSYQYLKKNTITIRGWFIEKYKKLRAGTAHRENSFFFVGKMPTRNSDLDLWQRLVIDDIRVKKKSR
jgi:hypothetical protein